MARAFEVHPAGVFARMFPLAIGAVFALALVGTVIAVHDEPFVLMGVVPAALVGLAAVAGLAWAIRHPRVHLEDGVLTVGRLPRLRVHARALDLAQARVVDLGAEPALHPRIRLLGTSLPGFREGWFWMRDRSRAYLLVTDPRHVLVLPRRAGGPVLLSVVAPEPLLDALRRAA
jgi:hypothetical protein